MPTEKTTPTSTYQKAGAQQAQGEAAIESGDTVEGKIEKARGVAKAQIAPNIDINDVKNVAD